MLPASDHCRLWAGRRKPSWTSLIAATAARRRWRQGELTVTPQPQASCLWRGGALKSQARPPPLPTFPGLPGVGCPSPVPAPQLLSADLNLQHSLSQGPFQSTCSFRIIAFEVKRGFSLSLKPSSTPFAAWKTEDQMGTGLTQISQPVDLRLLSPEPLWIQSPSFAILRGWALCPQCPAPEDF